MVGTQCARRTWSWSKRKRGLAWIPVSLLCVFVAGCFSGHTLLPAGKEEKDKVLDIPTVYDVIDVANVTPVQVVGVGLISGLHGTGGGTPTGSERTTLENDLKRRRVPEASKILDSPNYALVRVTALIPPGARKGDLLDVEVTLPPGSKVVSLRGGFLEDCYLYSYDSKKNVGQIIGADYQGPDGWLRGHALAKARGPLMVGLDSSSDEGPNLRQARLWDGGVSFIDRPYYLVLKSEKKLARIANAVANRINTLFQDDTQKQKEVDRLKELLVLDEVKSQINRKLQQTLGTSNEVAKAANRELIYVNVPWEYRLNSERYLRVLCKIPLAEDPKTKLPYRQKLQKMLLDPGQTIAAALRLEALGKESVPMLKKGLQSEEPLVRFSAAEALAYLRSTAGVAELALLADRHPQLRAYCLTALASMDENVCHTKLTELLASANAETRYGAFRALQILNDPNPAIKGELVGGTFWLHRVAPHSAPLVHFSLQRRAEVVLFGEEPHFVTPVRLMAGKEFTVTAEASDDRCTISRFNYSTGQVARLQTSLKLEEVLRALAELGAEYPDVVDLLRQADNRQRITCTVRLNAMPQPMPVEELALAGKDGTFLHTPAAELPVGTAGADETASEMRQVSGQVEE